MNDTERIVARIIAGIAMALKSSKDGRDLCQAVTLNGKEYKIVLTGETDFILYNSENDTPLVKVYNGIDDFSEAIDIISRRIDINR